MSFNGNDFQALILGTDHTAAGQADIIDQIGTFTAAAVYWPVCGADSGMNTQNGRLMRDGATCCGDSSGDAFTGSAAACEWTEVADDAFVATWTASADASCGASGVGGTSPPPTPGAVSLYDINYVADDGTDACAGSPLDGDVVTSHGYISAVTSDGFYMQQDLTGTLWGGIFIYIPSSGDGVGRDALATLSIGDYVEVTAEVEEYYGLTELLAPTVLTVLSGGHTLVPLAVSTGTLGTSCTRTGEQYEGLLVVVTEAQLMSEPNNYGEIEMDDGSGPTQLEDGILNTDEHLITLLESDSSLLPEALLLENVKELEESGDD